MKALKCLKYPYSECDGNIMYVNVTEKNGFLVTIILHYKNLCFKVLGPKFLHLIFLKHHVIFLQVLARGNIQPPSAHTEHQTYWHQTDPTGGCRALV